MTRLAWMAQRFASSKRCTRNASADSWSACMACDCHRKSSPCGRYCRAISRTCFWSPVSSLDGRNILSHWPNLPSVQMEALRQAVLSPFGIFGFPSAQLCLACTSSVVLAVLGRQLRKNCVNGRASICCGHLPTLNV